MKRLFFSLCMMFIVINLMAYQPMLVEGRIWTVSITWADPNPIPEAEHSKQIVYYKIQGDSILNNEIYKKVYISDNKTDWDLSCFMIEDTEKQKVWKYNNNNKDLIFDFSLNVGESKDEYGLNTCQNINYIKDKNGNILKKMEFFTYSLIESYGYEYNLGLGVTYTLSAVEDENGILIDCTKDFEYYNPIVVEGYSWNVVNYNFWLDNNRTEVYTTYSEKIEGDSVINGITYKKLWRSTDTEMTEYEIIGLIREDIANQKVWAYIGEKEYLVYDFACKVGDKITAIASFRSSQHQAQETEMTIKAIESIEDLNGVKYNKYIATVENQDIVYYERFGSTLGWYSRWYDYTVGGGGSCMICAFDATGELQFKPIHNNKYDEIENCYINETRTALDDVTIQPSPLKKVLYNGQLYIIHNNKIYNIMGVEMKNINFNF